MTGGSCEGSGEGGACEMTIFGCGEGGAGDMTI